MTSCATRGRWSPLHIAAVIAGFIVWWPLGLAALAFFIWGDRLPRDRVREGFERAKQEFGGFARETREPFGVAGEGFVQYLECDVAIEQRVARAIDLAHAAGADLCCDFVDAEAGAGGKCQEGVAVIIRGGRDQGGGVIKSGVLG